MRTQNPSDMKCQTLEDPGRLFGLPKSLQYFQTSPSPCQTRVKNKTLWIKSPASHLLSGL